MISILHILCKDNANREENEMNLFISYPEMQLILCKDNANRENNEINSFFSYLYLPLSRLPLWGGAVTLFI